MKNRRIAWFSEGAPKGNEAARNAGMNAIILTTGRMSPGDFRI